MMIVLRVLVLTAVFLLSLTSVARGDLLVGVVAAVVLVALLSRLPAERIAPPALGLPSRLAGVPSLLLGSLVDTVRGSWQVVLCCLRGHLPAPAFVEVDMGEQSASSAAIWGLRTGFSPDSVVVDIDLERGMLLLHVLDGDVPEAVNARERETFERRQRRVFP